MYIPKDEADRKEHDKLLAKYNTSDSMAYMSPFFRILRKKFEGVGIGCLMIAIL